MAIDESRHRALLVMHEPVTRGVHADGLDLHPGSGSVGGAVRQLIERRRLEEARFSTWERASSTLNSIGDGVLSTDVAGHVTYLNLAAEAMTGWSREAAAGRPIDEVFHIIDRETRQLARDPLRLAIQVNRTVGLTPNCILVRRDGHESEIEDSAAPIHGRDGQVTGAVIVFRDVGAALQTSRRMSHLAQHDVLTGIPNRLLLYDRLTTAIARAHRQHTPLAVLFLDVDGFKDVNDLLGHAVGDGLLRSIATRLSSALRQSDTVSRVGGDEFVIVLSKIERAEDAVLVANNLLQAVAAPHCIGAHEVRVTASLGATFYPDHGRDADTLITNADAAMYDAKRSGPGNCQRFDIGMNARALELQSIESSLRGALERRELELHYQPQVDLVTRSRVGVEALLRWRHPQRGLLPATAFVSVAEACGLMVPIGHWVLREVCRQARVWRDAGLGPATAAVNVSAGEFWRRDFLDDVQAILRDTGLDARDLALELTEDVLMQDAPSARSALRVLKGLGVHVAVDHFGTGHASLSDLEQFPADILKIDSSFVRELAAGVRGAPVLTAIVGLGKSLARRVMATGVETAEQLAFLQAEQCPEAQGHLFGHPIRAEHLGELLGHGYQPHLPGV